MIQEQALLGPIVAIPAISPPHKERMGKGRGYSRVVHYFSKDIYLLK